MGDRQHRPGGKTGGGGAATAQQESIDRRERLKKLALESIDIAKDPYFMKNHVGQFECKLCLTIHPTADNYLAHTQARRHQENLARRAAADAAAGAGGPGGAGGAGAAAPAAGVKRRALRIGRPGYRVVRARDAAGARTLLFEVEYPDIEAGLQPRHRFMSAFEQRVEAPDAAWQYVVFAAEPYETVAFKVPALELDRGAGKVESSWDARRKLFSLACTFREKK
jgi:splicing factor 3A subunit 2